MFYYQHHIGDFIKDTANLDDHQLAAYLRMIWIYYTEEKPFDDSVDDIAFAVRSDEKTVRLLLRHFFEQVVDKWHHKRCDREIADYHSKSDKARNSANARWSNAKAMRTHSDRNANEPVFDANREPITNNQKPIDKKKPKVQAVRPVDVSESVWQDFIAIRNKVNKPFTETALKIVQREAAKAGFTVEQALETCCARGWQGFEAKWVAEKLTASQERQNTMAQLTRGLAVPKPAKPFWEKSTDTVEIGNVEPKRLL